MPNRALASIRKVDKILQIPKCTNIELIQIGGWTCIAKKGEFQVNSLAVYFEIDSFLPDQDPYKFLGTPTTHQGQLGYRIRTMKLRGVLSQGLALPLTMFPELTNLTKDKDVTEELKVIKFDIDLTQNGKGQPGNQTDPAGSFPSFIPKTDQERIQNLPHYFQLHKDTLFEETLKLDGSSMTCYKIAKPLSMLQKVTNLLYSVLDLPKIQTYHFGVCSRNLELKRPLKDEKQSTFWTAADKYQLEKYLPEDYALQGELLAQSIQGNYEKVKDIEFHIFSIYDIKNRQYLPPLLAENFVQQRLPFAEYVPTTGLPVQLFQKCQDYPSLQTRVSGPSIHPDTISEGRVYKSLDGKTTFKVINNDYLLQKSK